MRHASAGQVLQLIAGGVADVAILGRHGDRPALPAGTSGSVISEEPLQIACAPHDPLAGRRDATIEALRGVPVILPERDTALRGLVAERCESAGFSPLPLFETSDPPTIRELAGSGLGISAVPASWLQGEGVLVGIAEFAKPEPRYRIELVRPIDDPPPIGRLLVEHLIRWFTETR
jgi:DNA-binding transcriptional LysR family regulator